MHLQAMVFFFFFFNVMSLNEDINEYYSFQVFQLIILRKNDDMDLRQTKNRCNMLGSIFLVKYR